MNQNKSLDSSLEQGHHQLEWGQYEAGLEVFQQADSLFPNNPQAKYGLGLAYYRLKQYQECIDCLNLALQIRAVYFLALVRRGMAYKALEQTESANADFEAVLQIKPHTHEDWRARGITFDELKRSESALECYDKALEIEPNDHQSLHNKGLSLQDLRRFDKALICFDKALEILPNKFFTIKSRGNVLIFLQQYKEAIASFNKALKLKPKDTFSLTSRGLALASLGQYKEAIISYERALELKPSDYMVLYFLGDALSSLKQYKEALFSYEKALEIYPDFQPAKKQWAKAQYSLGIAYRNRIAGDRKDNIELAIAAFTASLRVYTEADFPQRWANTQNSLGNAYSHRIVGDRQDNIELAIAAYTASLRVYTEADFAQQWANTQNNLGHAYRNRIAGDRRDNIELEIAAFTAVLKVRTEVDFPQQWANTQNNLGHAYRNRIAEDRKDNIELAIAAYNAVLKICSEANSPQLWANTQSGLGVAYINRIVGVRKDNLELAIAACTASLRVYTETNFSQRWADTQNCLGVAHIDRIAGDRQDNLELAIAACTASLRIYTETDFSQRWANSQNNLGVAYSYRIVGYRQDNLELAIAAYTASLRVYTETDFPQQWAMTQDNLGSAYRKRIAGVMRDNRELAIAACTASLRVYTEADFPQQWAMAQSNLGAAYLCRIVGDRRDNLEAAIVALTSVLKVRTKVDFPQLWGRTQYNLGNAYHDRIKGNFAENIELAIKSYQNALAIYTPQKYPLDCSDAARNLGNLALNQKRWQLAVDAYSQAIEAVEISRQSASSEARKQEILSNAISVYVNMARACIQDEQYTKAIEYLERSKTRNLVDLLANSQLHPRGVSRSILDSLDALRRNIIAAERRLQQQKTEECFNRLSSLRQSMEYLLRTHIQPVDPGFQLSERVEPIGFAQIQAALPTPQTAAIEWCVSKDTLAAFIVTKDRAKPLVITSDFEEVQTLIDIKDRYLSKYREYKEKWQERLILFLYQLAQTLEWDKIIKSLIQILPDCNKVILVPHRWLHIIPIHALPLKDGSCLLDRFPQGVSYAPSVQLFELTQKLSHPTLKNFFAVQNPTQDLQFTDIEVESIGSQFKPHNDIIKHKAAHRKALTKDRLSTANCTHFSCHGQFNFEKPELSALLLAESKVKEGQENGKKEETRFLPSRDGDSIDLDKCLTLGEIFTLDLRNCRLVTLSACETGLTDINNLSDEYIGLPSGFLYAGSPSVVSSLWAVDDISTSFLMIKFYQNLQSIDSVPIALNQAQLWLRSVTKEELEQWKDTLDIPGAQMFEIDGALRRMSDNSYPFASPYHWAAFCAVGS